MKGANESDVMGVRATPQAGEIPDSVTEEALRGATVHDREGQEIGTVNDVVVGDDGKIESVVMEVGGYLGIGSRAVAVAAHRLAVRDEDDGTRVILGMTQDELRELPEHRAPVTRPVVPPHPR
ncbi:MAG: PRC-barrel domain-containing protein [Trueperaceae bacterium]